MNPWLMTVVAILAQKGPIGLAALRAAMMEKHGGSDAAGCWFDAEFGVEGPRYVHTVDSAGQVTSTEVTR